MSLFGKPTAKSVFGGAGQPSPASVFGGQQAGSNQQSGGNAPQATSRGVKPATSSLFGKKTTAQSQPISFINTNSKVTPQSVFGNAKQQVNTQSTAPSTNRAASLFGQSSNSGASAFGGSQQTSQPAFTAHRNPQPPTASLFGSKAQPGAPAAIEQKRTLFGKPVAETAQVTETMASLYSQLADLTVNEVAAFTAEEFSLGSIPLKPPPQEACHG